jgi:hypothetical protein
MRNQPSRIIVIALLLFSQFIFANQADLDKIYFSATEQIVKAKNNKSGEGLNSFIRQLNRENTSPRVRNVLLKAFF